MFENLTWGAFVNSPGLGKMHLMRLPTSGVSSAVVRLEIEGWTWTYLRISVL